MNDILIIDNYRYLITTELPDNKDVYSRRSVYIGSLAGNLYLNQNVQFFEEERKGKERFLTKKSTSLLEMIKNTNVFPLLVKYHNNGDLRYAVITRTTK